jgi:hypothetical protein
MEASDKSFAFVSSPDYGHLPMQFPPVIERKRPDPFGEWSPETVQNFRGKKPLRRCLPELLPIPLCPNPVDAQSIIAFDRMIRTEKRPHDGKKRKFFAIVIAVHPEYIRFIYTCFHSL